MSCPCGNTESYENCCGLYIGGKKLPDTAEKLMRSRYSAHTMGAIDYIRETMVPEERKSFDPDATRRWANESKWKGLKILSTSEGTPDDTTGTVEFVATYERGGTVFEHHEVSQFQNLKGRWFFVDGEAHEHKEGESHHHHPPVKQVVREAAKVGRNEQCPCGSGKKYKKCCG